MILMTLLYGLGQDSGGIQVNKVARFTSSHVGLPSMLRCDEVTLSHDLEVLVVISQKPQ